jgi:hypothetical protein
MIGLDKADPLIGSFPAVVLSDCCLFPCTGGHTSGVVFEGFLAFDFRFFGFLG